MPEPAAPRARILVTGASRGIGRAVARSLVREGYDILAVARSATDLRKLAIEAGLGNSTTIETLALDLADRASVDRALSGPLLTGRSFRGVVIAHALNRGTPLSGNPLDFAAMIEADLVSPMRLLRALMPRLDDDGRVVLIGSILGRLGIPGQHGYCAAKAGLAGLARALALDLAPRRITVNCLQPGWVDTDMARASIEAQAPGMGMSVEEARRYFEEALPLKRFLTPEEVAAHVRWLMSPAARSLTGQVVNHDSGALV